MFAATISILGDTKGPEKLILRNIARVQQRTSKKPSHDAAVLRARQPSGEIEGRLASPLSTTFEICFKVLDGFATRSQFTQTGVKVYSVKSLIKSE